MIHVNENLMILRPVVAGRDRSVYGPGQGVFIRRVPAGYWNLFLDASQPVVRLVLRKQRGGAGDPFANEVHVLAEGSHEGSDVEHLTTMGQAWAQQANDLAMVRDRVTFYGAS